MNRSGLSVYSSFTAPQAIMQGALTAGAGIGGGLASVGDALGRAIERKKQEGKLSDQLSKLLETAYPERADEFKLMSYAEKQGVLEGEARRRGEARERLMMERLTGEMRDAAAQRQLPSEMMRLIGEQESAGMSPAEQLAGAGPLNAEAFDARAAGSGARSGISPGAMALIKAASAAGAPIHPSVLDNLIAGGNVNANEPLRFEEDPVTGARFGRMGKSVLPSGINPAKQTSALEEMFDAEGNLVGHRVPTGGGKFTFRPVKPAATGNLLPVLDPATGEPVAGMGMDATGKVHDYRDTLQKTMGSRAPGAAAPPATLGKAKGTKDSPYPDEASAHKAGVKPGQETWLMHNGKAVRVRMLE